jgi:hypothetical protein
MVLIDSPIYIVAVLNAGYYVHQRRLSCAVRAADRVNAAFPDGQNNIAQHAMHAEGLGQSLDRQRRPR